MAKDDIIDDDREYQALLRNIASLVKAPGLTIGVHGKDNEPYKRGQSSPPTTAQIASAHEFGTLDRYEDKSPAGDGSGKRGVPQRSFLRSTVDENRKKYEGQITRGIGKVIDGRMSVKRMIGIVGEGIVGDVKKKIASGIDPPLTEWAIRSKVKPSTKQLIDTGQLRQAITWQLDKD